jgi:hypothetical protein
MDSRIQVVSILVMAALFVGILELVRRRRLMERYALLWLFSATVLLAMAVWKDGLLLFARTVGIAYAPSALFAVALGFILLLLMHFSLVISSHSDQTKRLAQRVALLQRRVDELELAQAHARAEAEVAAADERAVIQDALS